MLLLHTTLLSVGVPLWILHHTSLPPVLVAAMFVLNTVLAVSLQVPVSAIAATLPGGVRAFRRAGLALALCCLLLTFSGSGAEWTAAVLLTLAVVALTFGEMLQAAGAWSAGYTLAPEERRASYLAVLGLGTNAQTIAGPLVVTAVVGAGAYGLVLLAAGLVAAAETAAAVVRRQGGRG